MRRCFATARSAKPPASPSRTEAALPRARAAPRSTKDISPLQPPKADRKGALAFAASIERGATIDQKKKKAAPAKTKASLASEATQPVTAPSVSSGLRPRRRGVVPPLTGEAQPLKNAELEVLRIRQQMEEMADDMERERKPKKKPKQVRPKGTAAPKEKVLPEDVPVMPTVKITNTSGQKYPQREGAYQATVEEVLALLEEERAEDVVVLDVRRKCNWTSYFIVATGKSSRQVEGMATFLIQKLKEKRQTLLYDMDESSPEWIALDLGEIVVHLMVPAMRKKYDLEALWMKRPELSPPDMFRQMLAPDPEDTEEGALPPDALSAGLSPEEAGVSEEELQEIEQLDDAADLKKLLQQEREAAEGLKRTRKLNK